MTINYDELIKATTDKIAESLKEAPAPIAEAIKANQEALAVQEAQEAEELTDTLESEFESIKVTSQQILAEPIHAIKGQEAISCKQVENSNQMAEAILGGVTGQLENVSALAENSESVDNQSIRSCINQAQNNCLAGSLQVAQAAGFASGSILMAPSNQLGMTSRNISMNSDSSIFARSPLYQNISQNHQVTANNSYSVVSDLQIKQSKTDVTLTSSQVTSSQDVTTVATNGLTATARINKQVGMEELSQTGANVNINAQNKLASVSQGTVETYGGESVTTQSRSVEMVAAADSSSTTTINASADGSTPGRNDAKFLMMSTNAGATSVMVGDKNGYYNSTTGYNYSLSTKGTVIKSDRSTAIAGGKSFSAAGGSNSSFGKSGAKTFIGSISINLPNFSLPKPISIPAFPTLPQLNPDDLKNCIPGNRSSASSSEAEEGDGTEGTEDSTNDTVLANQRRTPDLAEGEENGPTAENEVEVPVTNPDSDKLPPNSSTAEEVGVETKQNNMSAVTRLDIYFLDAEDEDLTTSGAGGEHSHEEGAKAINLSITTEDLAFIPELEEAERAAIIDQTKVIITQIIPNYPQARVNDIVVKNEIVEQKDQDKYLAIQKLLARWTDLIPKFAELVETKLQLVGIGYILEDDLTYLDVLYGDNPDLQIQENDPPEVNQKLEKAAKQYERNVKYLKQGNNLLSLGLDQGLIDLGANAITGNPERIKNSVVNLGATKAFDLVEDLLNPNLDRDHFRDHMAGLYRQVNDLIDTKGEINTESALGLLRQVSNTVNSSIVGDVSRIADATQNLFDEASAALAANPNLSTAEAIAIGENYLTTIGLAPEIITDVKATINQGQDIYNSFNQVATSFQNGNYQALFSTELSGFATKVLGANQAERLQKGFDAIIEGVETFHTVKDLVDTVAVLPDVIGAMRDYKMASLKNIAAVFQCLDLFNKAKDSYKSVKNLYEQVSDLFPGDDETQAELAQQLPDLHPENKEINSKVDTIRKLELLPRLIQLNQTIHSNTPGVINKITEIEDRWLRNLPIQLDLSESQKAALKIPTQTFTEPVTIAETNCRTTIQRTLLTSGVEVIRSQNKFIEFSLEFDVQLNDIPELGSTIQMYVSQFRNQLGDVFTSYTDDFTYTPNVYNFTILQYDPNSNRGVAELAEVNFSLILEKDSGVLVEYSIDTWNKKIFPIIKDVYLLS